MYLTELYTTTTSKVLDSNYELLEIKKRESSLSYITTTTKYYLIKFYSMTHELYSKCCRPFITLVLTHVRCTTEYFFVIQF